MTSSRTAPISAFEDLMQQVREGSQAAGWSLIEKYSSKILRVIRFNLPSDLRQKFDSQDFVQAAWASVFAHRSRLFRCHDANEFIAYLATIAKSKVKNQIRNKLAPLKDGTQRERRFDELHFDGDSFISNEPDPSDVAIAREQWFRLLNGLSDRHRRIVK